MQTSVVPTPADPFEEKEGELEVAGTRMQLVRKSTARQDSKRYLTLFKKHVANFNSTYSVKANRTNIILSEEVFGSYVERGVYDYKVGVIKKLYMLILHYRNVELLIEWLNHNELSPFSDSEYIEVETPPPDDAVIHTCRKDADDKWNWFIWGSILIESSLAILVLW